MEHKAPYALVGFFVCLCIAGMVGMSVWMKGDREKDYTSYTVLMPESVSGLEEGAQVLYRGIRVGKVEKLRLPQVDDSDVRVDIRLRNDVPVRKTSHAELARMSITGIVSLNIAAPETGDTEAPQRIAGEPYPVIVGQKSAFEAAMKDVPAITRQLRSFSGKLNESMDHFQGSFVGRLMGQKKEAPEDRPQDGSMKTATPKPLPRPQPQPMNLRN